MSIVFGIISAITVIIIIVQGIKFILSSGEPEKAASARKGIIYALIGLTISVSANLIVVFILKDLL
jgi:NAD/NADP transhydrogenase beta subunit